MESFEEYLIKKKIDSVKFKKNEAERWTQFKEIFEQVHPNSFTQQKLFLINKLRRRYFLEEKETEASNEKRVQTKPRVKIPLKKKD